MLLNLRKKLALALCPELSSTDHQQDRWDRLLKFIAENEREIWSGRIGPRWWRNAAMREFFTLARSEFTLDAAYREGLRRFGRKCPGRSTVARYWQKLDNLEWPADIPRPSEAKPKSRRVA